MANVSVYMGAAMGARPVYAQKAEELGASLAKCGHSTIYGGADVGLMKALADGVSSCNGRLIGVFPEGFKGRTEVQNAKIEILRAGMTETIFTPDFGSRIAKMDELSDACIVFPGGFGTFQEMFSYLVNQQIGKHSKPVILFNLDGFYDALLSFFDFVEAEGFVKIYPGRLRIAREVDEILDILATL